MVHFVRTLAVLIFLAGCSASSNPKCAPTTVSIDTASKTHGVNHDGPAYGLPYYATVRDAPSVSSFALQPAICHSNGPCTDYWVVAGAVPSAAVSAPPLPTERCAASGGSGFLASSADGSVGVLNPDRWQTDDDGDYYGDLVDWHLELPNAPRIAIREPMDAVMFAGEAFVSFLDGSFKRYPNGEPLPLRPMRAAHANKFRAFGIGQEFYALDDDSPGQIRALAAEKLPLAGYESPTPHRAWLNRDWILRGFGSTAGRFLEAAQRSSIDPRSRIVAYGGLSFCGEPLSGNEVLLLNRGTASVDVVAVNLFDRTEAWRVKDVPLDHPHCVSAADGIVAVGGERDGRGAVAIRDHGKWQVIGLASAGSVIEPSVRRGSVVVGAPGEDYVSPDTNGKRVERAGAVYVIDRGETSWSVTVRLVEAQPRPLGLFGFRTVFTNGELFINYYGGTRTTESPAGIPEVPAEICKYALVGRDRRATTSSEAQSH